MGVGNVGGVGCAALGCRSAFGASGVGCWWIVGYIEGSTGGADLMVRFTFGIGVDWFQRNKERIAMKGRTVKIRMSATPSLVIRK
jgi:hypothetical protein